MNEFGFDHLQDFKLRQRELQREAAQHRLLKEALNWRRSTPHNTSKLLATIGRKLVQVGESLVVNNSIKTESGVMIARHNSSVEC